MRLLLELLLETSESELLSEEITMAPALELRAFHFSQISTASSLAFSLGS
jgi:hypothetical protein